MKRLLTGIGLATLAAYLFVPLLNPALWFAELMTSKRKLMALASPLAALSVTWWYYLPAGAFFGVLIPRRAAIAGRWRVLAEALVMGVALGLVGVAGALVTGAVVARDFHLLPLSRHRDMVALMGPRLVVYCALWLAAFALWHTRRRQPPA